MKILFSKIQILTILFLFGSISVVAGLSDGLTEQAIVAAKKIMFIPAKVNNVPVTVSKQVEYSFSIY